MSENEKYPEGWVKLNLIIDPKTKTINVLGGDREPGEGDTPYIGYEILKEMLKNQVLKIYTITTMRRSAGMNSRCVGFYFDQARAIETVINNYGDIYEEGYYPYCVIEEVTDGIYSFPRKEIWFEWNRDTGSYEIIPNKPEKFNNICCFCFG